MKGEKVEVLNYFDEKKDASEVRIQKQIKCAYLGCNSIGIILDKVEVATNITKKMLVCSKHQHKLNNHIILESKN